MTRSVIAMSPSTSVMKKGHRCIDDIGSGKNMIESEISTSSERQDAKNRATIKT